MFSPLRRTHIASCLYKDPGSMSLGAEAIELKWGARPVCRVESPVRVRPGRPLPSCISNVLGWYWVCGFSPLIPDWAGVWVACWVRAWGP